MPWLTKSRFRGINMAQKIVRRNIVEFLPNSPLQLLTNFHHYERYNQTIGIRKELWFHRY